MEGGGKSSEACDIKCGRREGEGLVKHEAVSVVGGKEEAGKEGRMEEGRRSCGT